MSVTAKVGWTPLHHACRRGYNALVKYIVDRIGLILLHFACVAGNVDLVKYLLVISDSIAMDIAFNKCKQIAANKILDLYHSTAQDTYCKEFDTDESTKLK